MRAFTLHFLQITRKKVLLIPSKKSEGFTLVETLITIVVFTIIIVLIFGVIAMLYKTHSYSWQQSVAIDEARRGIQIMVKEIKEAKPGDDGSYPIEKAGGKEFIFYSDIDKDNETERVRYFLGTVSSGDQIETCVTFNDGGSCNVSFTNFLQGDLQIAQVKVSVEGDFGNSNEYAEIYADGQYLGGVCQTGCNDCLGDWQGTTVFDITSLAGDDSIQFIAEARPQVDNICDWQELNHAMKTRFELSWTEELVEQSHILKKGVVNPVGDPPTYPLDQEEITIISSYIRNTPPIFEYYNGDWPGDTVNNPLPTPVRLQETKLMRIYLVVNVNPNRLPDDYGIESYVQLRNLKQE